MDNEKKKSNQTFKITLFALAIILILTAALLRMIYLANESSKELENKESEITKLNERLSNLEKEKEELKTKDEEKKDEKDKNEKTTNEKVEEIKDVEELLKNGGEYDYLQVSSIKEDDDNGYLLTASYYTPITITEEEYDNMVTEETISIKDKEYIFEKEEIDQLASYGYGYIYEEGREVYSGYCIYKTEDGYIFLRDVGGVQLTIDEKEKEISFYLDGDTSVNEITVDTYTLEEYLLKDKENYKLDEYKMTVVYDENDEILLEADKR